MKDTIHKRKKDYPHFDKFYVSSPEYREGYDRIFGSKHEKGKNGKRNARRRKLLDGKDAHGGHPETSVQG